MAGAEWVDDHRLVVDGVSFVLVDFTKMFTSTPTEFCLVKRPELVKSYLRLLDELQPARIVEIGVLKGGSTAMIALAGEPEILVALERNPEPVAALETLVVERGLSDIVRPVYGVDQSDAETVRREVRRHIGDEALDLVIDDASHLVDPTRSSFNVLFPMLRPGGVFVIEDWSWAHIGYGVQWPDETPLTRLVFEATMALPSRPGIISEIRIDHDWAAVVRGDEEIDPEGFDISQCFGDRGRAVLAPDERFTP